jgi:hypothetical protein
MVKHKQRRMDHALHALRIENERKQLEKIEARKKKNEDKQKTMVVDQVGEKGEVKAMTIKFKGTFDLPTFESKPTSSEPEKDEDMFEPEDITGWVKSQRKKNGLEISKRYCMCFIKSCPLEPFCAVIICPNIVFCHRYRNLKFCCCAYPQKPLDQEASEAGECKGILTTLTHCSASL